MFGFDIVGFMFVVLCVLTIGLFADCWGLVFALTFGL